MLKAHRRSNFVIKFQKKYGGHVTFGDDAKKKIIGIGIIDNHSSPTIENVLLIDNLKYNISRISQLCNKDYYIKFDSLKYLIKDTPSKYLMFIGSQSKNVYH